jgi:hypothetical protein
MELRQAIATGMKNLADRISGRQVDIGRGNVDASTLASFTRQFSVGYERTAVHRDMHRMDQDDEIIARALDMIANRAMGYPDPTVNSFGVNVQGANDSISEERIKEAQAVADGMIDRCTLRPAAWQIARKGVKFGNHFCEILYQREGENIIGIGGLKALPEHTLWPNVDAMGNRTPGYTQKPENMPNGTAAVPFAESEILHFLFGDEDGYLGTPLMKPARKNWKRLSLAEDFTAIARLVRAFAKLVHRIPTGNTKQETEQRIADYKKAMTGRSILDDDSRSIVRESMPQTVATDLYIPDDGTKRGGVEMLDPANTQLSNITDIEHFLNRLITATTIPKRYFPFEGSTPKLSEGGGNSEDVNFACTIMMVHQMLQTGGGSYTVSTGGFNKLFAIEFVLNGLNPADFRIVYTMAPINVTDLLRAAQTDVALANALGTISEHMPGIRFHPEVIMREYTSLSDASQTALLADKQQLIDPLPDEMQPKGNQPPPTPVTLPGMGNPEAKSTK